MLAQGFLYYVRYYSRTAFRLARLGSAGRQALDIRRDHDELRECSAVVMAR
jgi:hypothetical protein